MDQVNQVNRKLVSARWQLEVVQAGVGKPIDVTEEDQMEGVIVPEDTENAMTEEEEEAPRAGVVVVVPHRDPLRHMIRERA